MHPVSTAPSMAFCNTGPEKISTRSYTISLRRLARGFAQSKQPKSMYVVIVVVRGVCIIPGDIGKCAMQRRRSYILTSGWKQELFSPLSKAASGAVARQVRQVIPNVMCMQA
eukprot:4788369-Amphidinium_carterae.1